MKSLFSKILICASLGLLSGSALAALIGPTRINGGNTSVALTAGTTTFSVPGSGLNAYVLRSIDVESSGSFPTGATEVVTLTIADSGITNVITFNITSNNVLASKGRFVFPNTANGATLYVITNGVSTSAALPVTNVYVYAGATVTIAVGTNGGRAAITADGYTGGN